MLTQKDVDRLYNYVVIAPPMTCWLWCACTSRGYGVLKVRGRMRHAHRLMHELHNGPIESGMVLDHLCRNRNCVNPQHLEAVSDSENKRRGVGATGVNARRTHCENGHELTPDNVYTPPSRPNARYCRECKREQDRHGRRTVRHRRNHPRARLPSHMITHCPYGHPYNEENTAWQWRDNHNCWSRSCKSCRKNRQQKRKAES